MKDTDLYKKVTETLEAVKEYLEDPKDNDEMKVRKKLEMWAARGLPGGVPARPRTQRSTRGRTTHKSRGW